VAESPAEQDPEVTTPSEYIASQATDPASARAALDRTRFLAGATVGLGGLLSAVIAAPALAFVLAPAFETETHYDVDLGPTSLYPEDKSNPFHVVTFTRKPNPDGNLDRRVVFIRNDGSDSFTAIANTCMHLGCPVRVFGSSGFGCPCHGGQYDSEGRRIAGPPVRPLNRYATKVVNGRLILGELYAMDEHLHRHKLKAPGQPVTGLLSYLDPPAPQ
jgi:quinol---cytochrome c reductase iron-sulfur subunit, bacillus type